MDFCVIDIETSVTHDKPSVDDELRVFTWKDNNGNKGVILVDDLYSIQQIIKKYPIIIGYNIKSYDIPILKRFGCQFDYKIILDLYELILKHENIIPPLKNLPYYNLEYVASILKLKNQKSELDYDKLKGESWRNHLAEITEYAVQDIEVEYELFKWLEDFFEPFKFGLSQLDIDKYRHVTMSTSVYAYKVICNLTGIKEEYDDKHGDHHGKYKGGYVADPEVEFITGLIVELDFGSAYPHAYMQGNLFSNKCNCCREEERWSGGNIFKEVKGRYCTKQNGLIESTIKKLYLMRKEFKKEGDRREYAIKILLNIMYGICGNPAFKNVYDLDRASDCTYIGRMSIQYARERLRSKGYGVLYSDTDSIYVDLQDKRMEELIQDKDEIIKEIKNSVPFPQDTFDMPPDKHIKLMYFPKKMKKNYLFVTEDNKMFIKGLKIIKSNKQQVSLVVFEKYIKPRIINELRVKFSGQEIKDWIEYELANNIELACTHMKVKKMNYKLDNQIHNQVYKLYGEGNHKLIPNFKFGAGMGIKLCSIQDFKNKELTVKDVNLQAAYNELQFFTDDKLVCKTLYFKKSKKRVINTLEQWIT